MTEYLTWPISICHRKNLASKCPCDACEHNKLHKDEYGYTVYSCSKYISDRSCNDLYFWLKECQLKLKEAESKIDLSAIEEKTQ